MSSTDLRDRTHRGEDRLSRTLRDLPRVGARPGFTDAVVTRLKRRALAPVRPPGRVLLAAAAVAALAFGSFGLHEWSAQRERRAAAERIALLRAEHRALEAELGELQRRAAEARPLLYLGGTDDVDFVIDLARFAARERRSTAGSPAPTANLNGAPDET